MINRDLSSAGTTLAPWFRGASICTLLLLLGCGASDAPDRATVTGQVTVDGQLLDEGSINFIPTDDTPGPVAGGTIKDGRYLIANGVSVGKNRVEIRGKIRSGRTITPVPPAPPDPIEEMIDAVGSRYNTDSILEVEIVSGTNEIDFPLDAK